MKREGLLKLLQQKFERNTVPTSPDPVHPCYRLQHPIVDWEALGWVDDQMDEPLERLR